jgi:tetratricopeptide (TPR) repeat protein
MALEDIERLKEKIEKDPDSKLFVPLAEEYKKAGMLDEAIEALSKGLDRQPTYLSARVSLAKIYIEKGMLNEARDEFEKVTQVIPDNLYAHKKLAEIFRDLGEDEKAIYEFKTVLKLNPSDEWATSNLSDLEKEPGQEIQELSTERDIDLQPSPEAEPLDIKEEEPQLPPEVPAEQEETPPIVVPEGEEEVSLETLRTEIAEDFETVPKEHALPPQEVPDMWEIPDEDTEPPLFEEPAETSSVEQKEELRGLQEDESAPVIEEEAPLGIPALEEEKNFWELSLDEGIEPEDATEEPPPGEFPEATPLEREERTEAEVVAPQPDIDQAPSLQDADRFVSEENYKEALSIYSALLSNDPNNRDLIQRVHELKSLLKLLGKDKEVLVTKLEKLLEGIKKRRDEFS